MIMILFGMIISTQTVCSQSNFYLKPAVNYKLSETHLPSLIAVRRLTKVPSTEYFDAEIKKFSTTNSINLGLGIGMIIGKNNKIELLWSNDVVTSTMDFQYFTYLEGYDIVTGDPYKSYSASSMPFSSFLFNHRFEIRYYQSLSSDLTLSLGAGFHYTNSNLSNARYETEATQINNQADSIKFGWIVHDTDKKLTPFLSIGLEYKINAGETYLFHLSSYYVLGLKFIEMTGHKVTVFNATDSFNYNYLTGSKGGGIYFEISREMDFSAISHNTRNVFKKIFKRNKNEEYRTVINPL